MPGVVEREVFKVVFSVLDHVGVKDDLSRVVLVLTTLDLKLTLVSTTKVVVVALAKARSQVILV